MSGGPSPRTAEKMVYIQRLEEQQRKKKLPKKEKQALLEKREQKFALHFGGANRGGKKKQQPKERQPLAAAASNNQPRRTWGRAPAGGEDEIEEDYDDDFVDESVEVEEEEALVESPPRELETAALPPQKTNMALVLARKEPAVECWSPETMARSSRSEPSYAEEAVLNSAGRPAAFAAAAVRARKKNNAETPKTAVDEEEAAMLISLRRLRPSQQRVVSELIGALDSGTGPMDDAQALKLCMETLKKIAKAKKPPKEPTPAAAEVVVLRIHDGWGTKRVAGLDSIAVVYDDGTTILKPKKLELFAAGRRAPPNSRSAAELGRLLHTRGDATSEAAKSWIVRLPTEAPVEVALTLPRLPNANSKIRIYNCSATMPNGVAGELGARKIELLYKGRVSWSGELSKPSNQSTPFDLPILPVEEAVEEDQTPRVTPEPSPPPFEEQEEVEVEEAPAPVVAPVVVAPVVVAVDATRPLWLDQKHSAATPRRLSQEQDDAPASSRAPSRQRQRRATPFAQPPAPAPAADVVEEEEEEKLMMHALEGTAGEDSLMGLCEPSVSRPTDSQLAKSWTSLDLFSRKSKSRLGAAGAATIMQGAPITLPVPIVLPQEEAKDPLLASQYSSKSEDEDRVRTSSEEPYVAAAEEQDALEETMIDIPTLPSGSLLRLELLETWGDPHYVGLQAIECFDKDGNPVKIASIQAEPPSINVLPEYDSDPRTAEKLVDGVCRTCDDLHAWLAPWDDLSEHAITLEFDHTVQLSMLRLWNYNKSRAHSYRGVRSLRASLDGQPIFQGEVRKASGSLEDNTQAEMILFTLDAKILATIEEHDAARDGGGVEMMTEAQKMTERPATADGDNEEQRLRRAKKSTVQVETYETMLLETDGVDSKTRPRTSAPGRKEAAAAVVQQPKAASVIPSNGSLLPRCRRLRLRLESTWGDPHYVGLNGVSVLGGDSRALELRPGMLQAQPRDLRSLGYATDPRTLETLVDGVSNSCEDSHMWLVPHDTESNKPPWLEIDLGREEAVSGLIIHNYNKSEEDTLRGAKMVSVELDGRPFKSVQLRPAPGRRNLDFGQLISFSGSTPRTTLAAPESVSNNLLILNDYETLQKMPSGSYLRFVLHGSWGDPFYVGLDGIQLIDAEGALVNVEQVTAVPHSLRMLGGQFASDPRVPENLFNDGTWLAPSRVSCSSEAERLSLPEENELYVFLDAPVQLSAIKIRNYSKTPERGCREFSLWLDGDLVARCRLRATKEPQTLHFGNVALQNSRKRAIAVEPQDVLCIDENQVKVRSKTMFESPDACAEGVFDAIKDKHRPSTSAIRTK